MLRQDEHYGFGVLFNETTAASCTKVKLSEFTCWRKTI